MRASRGRRRAATPDVAQPLLEPFVESVPAVVEPVADATRIPPELAETLPERSFAGRTPPPEPDRPLPSARRAIFFDVENTSRAAHVARLIDHLAVDRLGRRTDFVAVGNWRVIGPDTARLLARHGAHLVHAAPSVGVKDWSDLRIAVSAGVWLGTARPGDILEIVSDDRAFDAVGDVAATLGIAYRRLSYRSLSGAPEHEPVQDRRAETHERRADTAAHGAESRGRYGRYGRRRGGRGRGPSPVASAPAPVAAPHREPAAHAAGHIAEAHTAPHDEIISVVRDLIVVSPDRSTTLDALANTLKARGFSRPPGSPRLITRLRRIKEVAVSRSGTITLTDSASAAPARTATAATFDEPEIAAVAEEPTATEATVEADETASAGPPRRRRRSRRGGRRHRHNRGEASATS